jgi:sec-independent protein translocase protein TatA
MDIGLPELIIVLVILLILFGSTRLPKLSKAIGQSAKELKDGFEGYSRDGKKTEEAPQKQQ